MSASADLPAATPVGLRWYKVVVDKDSLALSYSKPVVPSSSRVEAFHLPCALGVHFEEDPEMRPGQAIYERADGSQYACLRWKTGPPVFNATLLTYYDIFQDAEVRVLRIGDRNLLLETKTLTNSIIVSQPLQNVETVGSFRQQTHFLTSSTTISPSQHASVLHRLKPNVVKEPVRAVQYIPPSATARYDARLAKPKVRIQTPGRPVATKLYTPNKPAPQYVDFAVTGKKWPARMREAPCHEAHMEWSPSHLNRILASAKRITDDLL